MKNRNLPNSEVEKVCAELVSDDFGVMIQQAFHLEHTDKLILQKIWNQMK